MGTGKRMSCERQEELLLFDELDPRRRTELAEHAASCPVCGDRLLELRGLSRLLARESVSLPARVLAAAESLPDRRSASSPLLSRRAAVLASAAAALAAGILFSFVFGRDRFAPVSRDLLSATRAATGPADAGTSSSSTNSARKGAIGARSGFGETTRLGPDLLARVRSALVSSDASSIRFLDRRGASVLVPLLRIAEGGDVRAARAAIRRLGAMRKPEALPALSRAVRKVGRRAATFLALGEIGDERAVPVLAPFLDDPAWVDPARRALVHVGGERAAGALARAVGRGALPERAASLVAALGRVGGVAATRVLLRLAGDSPLAMPSREALEANRGRLGPCLIDLARDPNGVVARRAVRALGFLAPPGSVAALEKLLRNRDLRPTAARALVRIDTPAAARALFSRPSTPDVKEALGGAGDGIVSWLVSGLRGDGPLTPIQAIKFLGATGSAKAIPALSELAPRPAFGPAVVRALARIGGEDGIRALRRLALDARLRREIVAALGETRDPRAVPVLCALAWAHPSLKEAAVQALSRIKSRLSIAAILAVAKPRRAFRALAAADPGWIRKALESLRDGDLGRSASLAVRELVGTSFSRKQDSCIY